MSDILIRLWRRHPCRYPTTVAIAYLICSCVLLAPAMPDDPQASLQMSPADERSSSPQEQEKADQRIIPRRPPTAPAASDNILPVPPPPLPQFNTVPPAPIAEQETTGTPDSQWTVIISPRVSRERTNLATNYQEIYNNIPYRRVEYLANPSYRHDTTVEILFGQMRSTVINRNDTPQRVINPRPQLTQPYPISQGELYSYWPLLQYSYPLPLLSPIE